LKVLVVGSGGREHAIVWKLSKSSRVEKLYCAPGNAGIGELCETVDIEHEDIESLMEFAKGEKIDLTIVGPEIPLVMGIADRFKEEGLKIFGPGKAASMLEGSKVFSKSFMKKYNLPTARYEEYERLDEALLGLEKFNTPLVIKADGLAAGKGVIIANSKEEARKNLYSIMGEKELGSAGEKVIIEEYLDGTETSLLCFIDGETIIPMTSARDYKRAFDNDLGPNTGGMGTLSPSDNYNSDVSESVKKTILVPLMEGLKKEGLNYSGVLFIGIMIVEGIPKILEFNVRFGDPETQVILPRLKTDFLDIVEAVMEGKLKDTQIEWREEYAVCVMLSSGGYPQKYETGKEITGIEKIKESLLFHSGTRKEKNRLTTSGGRVIGVTALGKTLEEARRKAYSDAERIDFYNKQYRKDIGDLSREK
jgi:phosphoribosylamine---glycine ligase